MTEPAEVNDDEEERKLEAGVAAIRANKVSKKARDNYRRSSARYILGLYQNRAQWLNPAFFEVLETEISVRDRSRKEGKKAKAWIKEYLDRSSKHNVAPVILPSKSYCTQIHDVDCYTEKEKWNKARKFCLWDTLCIPFQLVQRLQTADVTGDGF